MKRCLTRSLALLMLLSLPVLTSCARNTAPEPEVTLETETQTAPATQTVPIPTQTDTTAADENAAEASSDTPQEETSSAYVPSLIGSWSFAFDTDVDFYYTFLQDGGLQISNDLTEILTFENDQVTIVQGIDMGSYPYTVDGDRLIVEKDGTAILDLTALDTSDASALQGMYRINNCVLYPDAESKDLQLRFDPNKLWIVAGGTYSVENNTLHMTSGDNTFSQEFAFEGDKLIFTEEDGSETVLVRLEQG